MSGHETLESGNDFEHLLDLNSWRIMTSIEARELHSSTVDELQDETREQSVSFTPKSMVV
jgi:hypothetical protein